MCQNIILLSKDYNIIKQNDPHDSEMRAAAVEYQKFFFLWDRSQGDVIRRRLHYPVWASPDSSSAPSSNHQRVPGRPLYPRWLRTQESNSWQWAQLTDNRATKPQWLWQFSLVYSIYNTHYTLPACHPLRSAAPALKVKEIKIECQK